MPAIPFKEREVWQLVAHIKDLNLRKGATTSVGDPARGAQIFADRNCARCHTAGTEGGFFGPDLRDIGLRRSVAQLERAVLDPAAEVAPEFWTLRARTKSGQTVSGIRLNEDMDSFQIREQSGKLRSLWKSELAHYELAHTSPMPSFKDKLQPGELQDLVAFLASLKGPRR